MCVCVCVCVCWCRQLLEQVSGDNRPQQSVSAGTSVVPGGGVSMVTSTILL